MEYLTVRNFERFQHYKDRAVPSWIKLYAALLHDYEFQQLPEASQCHLMKIWILVSQRNDRRIPNDPKWVGTQIGAQSKVNLKILIENHWLIPLDEKGREVQDDPDFRAEAMAILATEEETKEQARVLFGRAVARGEIQKAPCEQCGESEVEGHHTDYSKPLEVIWLCTKDHKARHVRLKSAALLLMKSSSVSVPKNDAGDSGPVLSSPLLSSDLLSSQEGESEGEPKPEGPPLNLKPAFDGTPQDLMESWNEVCVPAGLPAVEKLSATRKQKAMLRLRENPSDQFWETVLSRVAHSAFLRGLRNGNGKHEHWKASFDWLIDNDTNAVKISEGRYDG